MTGGNCWKPFGNCSRGRLNKINHQQRDWRQRLSHLRHLLRPRPRPFLPLLLEQLSHCKCRKNLDSSLKSTDEDASLLDRFSSTSIKLCLQIIRHLYFNSCVPCIFCFNVKQMISRTSTSSLHLLRQVPLAMASGALGWSIVRSHAVLDWQLRSVKNRIQANKQFIDAFSVSRYYVDWFPILLELP